MVDRRHDLALSRQAALLELDRGGLYDEPRPVPPSGLAIMRRIDELHRDYSFAGARKLRSRIRRMPAGMVESTDGASSSCRQPFVHPVQIDHVDQQLRLKKAMSEV